MIISEKQIMHLIHIAQAYCVSLLKLGIPKQIESVQELSQINDQQSEEPKVIE